MTETPAPAVHFATSLVPYRSLTPEGFKWLIRVAVVANLAIGLPMLMFGAWPVLGFMGLDVLLLWLLFKRSYLDARRSETLVLTDHDLIVERVAPDGAGLLGHFGVSECGRDWRVQGAGCELPGGIRALGGERAERGV